MDFDTLLYESREGIAFLTLNRPQRLNALNRAMIADLTAAAAAVAADGHIRAVVLSGAGRAFCSGADLAGSDLWTDAARSPGENVGSSLREAFNPMVSAWYHLPQPVVVAVNGVAAGAGMSLALLGDLVIAARSATFLQLFAPKLGLIPDLGSTFFLPRLIGTARAKGLALLGDPLSAAAALEWGLIWACVEDASLAAEAESLARRLAAGPGRAFRCIKSVFNAQLPDTLEQQLELEAVAQAQLADTADFAEGLRAFREKRPPVFSGR
jgi:2-(1,2-epoxy-1,2-dihydrophenyl)acetyl-CoA isomerase